MAAILAVQCALIVAASLAGGSLPEWIRLTHRRMQFAMSFVGGLMLGIALLQLLPHAAAELGVRQASYAVLVGLLLMFFLLRTFHFHQHEPLEPPHVPGGDDCEHDHHHHHAPSHGAGDSTEKAHRLSWGGVAFGLAVHTLIDGIALGAAVRADTDPERGMSWLAGLGVFVAILAHKPLDAVSITSLMSAGGWSPRARLTVNAIFAAMCPVGALLFVMGVDQFGTIENQLISSALGISAGVFLCISMSDLLPEIEFHTHDQVWLTVCLVAGVATAACLSMLEPNLVAWSWVDRPLLPG